MRQKFGAKGATGVSFCAVRLHFTLEGIRAMVDTEKRRDDEILVTDKYPGTAEEPLLDMVENRPIDGIDMSPVEQFEAIGEPGRERVRFVAPVWVRGEGDNEDYEGVVLNLSLNGLACAVPTELRSGERIWTRFRLALAKEPLKLFCEVLWKRPTPSATAMYGLRFLSLTDDEKRELACVIDERVQGRAAEWPLPVIPDARTIAHAAQPSRLPAVGVAIAATFIAVSAAWLLITPGSRAASPDRATDKNAAETMSASTAMPAPTPSSLPAAAVSPAVPAANPAPATTNNTEPTKSASAEKATAASKTTSDTSSKKLPRCSSMPTPSSKDDTLRPLGGRDSTEVALLADGPIDQHAEFWLENPPRLVVDIMHRKSGFSRLSYAISSPLVTKMRVGEHSDKVRFVIEATREVSQEFKVRPKGNSLVVQFKRR
jgi:hypothetical protein